jgi:hypothetical protein
MKEGQIVSERLETINRIIRMIGDDRRRNRAD